jgi:hypothetical protein
MLFYIDRSRYVYEKKGKYDLLPETDSDICAEFARLLQKIPVLSGINRRNSHFGSDCRTWIDSLQAEPYISGAR